MFCLVKSMNQPQKPLKYFHDFHSLEWLLINLDVLIIFFNCSSYLFLDIKEYFNKKILVMTH